MEDIIHEILCESVLSLSRLNPHTYIMHKRVYPKILQSEIAHITKLHACTCMVFEICTAKRILLHVGEPLSCILAVLQNCKQRLLPHYEQLAKLWRQFAWFKDPPFFCMFAKFEICMHQHLVRLLYCAFLQLQLCNI